MNSNYMFAFNRRHMGPPPSPAPRSLDAGSLGPAPRSLDAGSLGPAPGPVSSSPNGPGDRFSINRLIHYKSAGGCRSCN